MKPKAARWLGIGVFVFLIPCVITSILNGNQKVTEKTTAQTGCYIVSGQEKVDVEQYLIGAIAAYVPDTYEAEVEKAMAVILRTHLIRAMGDNTELNEEELSITHLSVPEMEALWGNYFTDTYKRYQQAVIATEGELLYHEGELIEPYFHKISAGSTNCMTGYGYLESAESKWDIQAEEYLSFKTISAEEFLKKLLECAGEDKEKLSGQAAAEGDELVNHIILEDKGTPYKTALVAYDVRIPASKVQEVFSLNSTAFTLESYEGNIRIMTKGIGHGQGVSLYGANQMAAEGKSYQEILKHYYSNITFSHE